MLYTKFIASPFRDFNTNSYIADALLEIFDIVSLNDDETLFTATLRVIQNDHPYLCQYIDIYIGDEGDQQLIKTCNQISTFLMWIITVYADVFERICSEPVPVNSVYALEAGVMVKFYD